MTWSVVDIIQVAISGALLSYMYSICLEEGMIFEKLGDWLEKGKWYHKILGGCIYCNSVYVTAIMIVLFLFLVNYWAVISILALSFWLVDMMTRNED